MPPALGWLVVNDGSTSCEVLNDARLFANLACRLGTTVSVDKRDEPCAVMSLDPCSDPEWEELDYTDITLSPWYDENEDASAEFLGFWVTEFDFPAVVSRTTYERSGPLGGATMGRLKREQREMPVSLVLAAESDRGLRWGFDWLLAKLTGCDDCSQLNALIRLSCGDTDDPTDGLWEIRRLGLLDPPSDDGTPFRSAGCLMREVSFTLVAGDPCRYRCSADLVVEESFVIGECVSPLDYVCPTDLPDYRICAEVSAPGVVYSADVNVLIDAGKDGCPPMRIRGALNPLGLDCADARLEECMELTIAALGPGEQVLVDSTNQRVWWSAPETAGARVDGTDKVFAPSTTSPEFLTVSGCHDAYVWVEPARMGGLTDFTQITIQSTTRCCT